MLRLKLLISALLFFLFGGNGPGLAMVRGHGRWIYTPKHKIIKVIPCSTPLSIAIGIVKPVLFDGSRSKLSIMQVAGAAFDLPTSSFLLLVQKKRGKEKDGTNEGLSLSFLSASVLL